MSILKDSLAQYLNRLLYDAIERRLERRCHCSWLMLMVGEARYVAMVRSVVISKNHLVVGILKVIAIAKESQRTRL